MSTICCTSPMQLIPDGVCIWKPLVLTKKTAIEIVQSKLSKIIIMVIIIVHAVMYRSITRHLTRKLLHTLLFKVRAQHVKTFSRVHANMIYVST